MDALINSLRTGLKLISFFSFLDEQNGHRMEKDTGRLLMEIVALWRGLTQRRFFVLFGFICLRHSIMQSSGD